MEKYGNNIQCEVYIIFSQTYVYSSKYNIAIGSTDNNYNLPRRSLYI